MVSQKSFVLAAAGSQNTGEPCLSATAADFSAAGAQSGETLVVGSINIRSTSFFEAKVTASIQLRTPGSAQAPETISLLPASLNELRHYPAGNVPFPQSQ